MHAFCHRPSSWLLLTLPPLLLLAACHGPSTVQPDRSMAAWMQLQRTDSARWLRRPFAAERVSISTARLLRIDSLMRTSITQHAFPGASVALGSLSGPVLLSSYGRFTYDDTSRRVTPQSLFDMASVTKVVATTTAAMLLYEEGRLNLHVPVTYYLPAFGQNGKDAVTVWHLLTHSSGLPPFHRFYLMDGIETRQDLVDAIMADSLRSVPGMQSVYSDLGIITLQLIIEEITGQDLDDWAEEHIFKPLHMTRTGFRPVGTSQSIPDSMVVPTEIDRVFRHRLVQGRVHDENAYLMGGVAGHAGLFSTVEDLAKFAYMLANEGRIYGHQFLAPETIALFTRRVGIEGSTRAIGWDTRSLEGYSSAGHLFGPKSFGHTGFTGTSLWIDPQKDLFAILLTNRVYPTRENHKLTPVRSKFADLAYLALAGPTAPVNTFELSGTRDGT